MSTLPLRLVNENDYEKFRGDLITIDDDVREGKTVEVMLQHSDGTKEQIQTKHTITSEELKWFKAGSALNWFKKKNEGKVK